MIHHPVVILAFFGQLFVHLIHCIGNAGEGTCHVFQLDGRIRHPGLGNGNGNLGLPRQAGKQVPGQGAKHRHRHGHTAQKAHRCNRIPCRKRAKGCAGHKQNAGARPLAGGKPAGHKAGGGNPQPHKAQGRVGGGKQHGAGNAQAAAITQAATVGKHNARHPKGADPQLNGAKGDGGQCRQSRQTQQNPGLQGQSGGVRSGLVAFVHNPAKAHRKQSIAQSGKGIRRGRKPAGGQHELHQQQGCTGADGAGRKFLFEQVAACQCRRQCCQITQTLGQRQKGKVAKGSTRCGRQHKFAACAKQQRNSKGMQAAKHPGC